MVAKRKRKSNPQTDYDVGYGKPPKNTRFKKGQSGNPKGRRRGRKNVVEILKETLYRPVRITQNGQPKTVPAIEALSLSLLEKALAGDLRAYDMLARQFPHVNDLIQREGCDGRNQESVDAELDRKILAEFADMISEGGNPWSVGNEH